MHQPAVEMRNRKPMRPNPVAPWELRIGNLRVYMMWKKTLNSSSAFVLSASRNVIGFASVER